MRSGLPRHDYAISGHTLDAEIITKLRYLEPSAEIRQAYQYCNMHYGALAHIVTTLTGIEYVDWVTENVIKPLGLNATYDYDAAEVAEGFAHIGVNYTQCALSEEVRRPDKACMGETKPFGWWVTGSYTKGADAGAGGLMMSARDVGRWLSELLDPQHINPAALALVSTPIIVAEPARPPELGLTTYGAGQAMVNYRGFEVVHHGGFVPGQASEFLRVPSAGVALGIMTNDHTWGDVLASALAWRVLDDLLGLEPIDWEALAVREMWDAIRADPTPTPPTTPEPAPVPGEGTYTHPGYGSFTLTRLPRGKANTTAGEIARALPLLGLRTDAVLYAELDGFLPSHFTLAHWSGAFWNLTNWLVYDRQEQGVVALNPGISWPAVVTEEGLGLFGGFAGAGMDVPPRAPKVKDLKERAEVFFAREGRSALVVQGGPQYSL
ncbi:beta-lactamase/transpeptidase-like protein [Cutaneotrichosporon oleaginosum]|uniref:Beta-lactamase/transpeptidase-like protein n=2 Tax=Cutaneotrichosporon oleaginosum TaxID=879819 RepID=A0A0J0XRD6_9TREE|nr:beta-lactamase/transpeptidase-like protein [Cutaneotrichosporon oleaginosum]KLT43701.1 beta-lactamase/transpeptidase-like protein [Cutaneotrichosporon oleaginosum]